MQHPSKSEEETSSEAMSNAGYSGDKHLAEIDKLQRENQSLRSQLTKLSEASYRIIQGPDLDSLFQEVVESARALTGASYAVLLTYDSSGNVNSAVASGISPEQINSIGNSPVGLGLLGYLNEVSGPVRIADISAHPMSIGFPENHPPMSTFLGMNISHQGEHIGNLFLTEKTEKLESIEFTSGDEEILVMFSSLVAQAISNAHRYQAVTLAKADMETLINISPIGVAVFDAKTATMISSNREARRISGILDWPDRSRHSLLKLLSFKRADGRTISLEDLPTTRVLQSGEIVRAEEIVIEFPDGRTVSTLVNAAPIYAENGEITTVVVTIQDMTPLEDLERLRAEFLGMVSQELRVPLATIKGSTQALLETLQYLVPMEAPQLLRIIDQQTDLMRAQINSLIDLTQIEAGTTTVSADTTTVSELVEKASLEFQRTHASIVIEKDIPSDIPMVSADRERINQVLKNLFSEISNHAQNRASIKVTVSQIDIYVAVSVRYENGQSLDDLSALPSPDFLEGHRGDTERGEASRDLAFAFCRGIVEAHGGRIRAERGERGFGMVYTFTLPAADESMELTAETIEDSETFSDQTGNQPADNAKILLVVPDGRTLGTVRRTLSDANFSSIAATELGEIDRLFEQEKPNIVLLDLSKSEQAGMRLTQRLSRDLGVPVIVLSEKGEDNNIARAFEMGADDYLVKPFSPTELVARIKSSLRKHSAYQRAPDVSSGYSLGEVSLDFAGRTLTVSGTTVQLTATEFKLLFELSGNAGRVLTQDELLHRVWGPEYTGEPQLLRSYVKSLRQKLGDNARHPTYIFTEHGIGYRMAKP